MQGISLSIWLDFPRSRFLVLEDQIQGLGAGIREIQIDNARFGHAVNGLGIRLRRPYPYSYPHKSLSNLSCDFLRLSISWRREADNTAIFRG